MRLLEKELLQLLCPFGNWPHAKGMQVVDEEAAQKMRKNFARSLAGIFGGLPIYIGHPDDGGGAKARPVGRIERICVTAGGIAVCARYGEEAFFKIASGELKNLSPRWRMQDLGGGFFRPVRLVSAGLTNSPNIPRSGEILEARAPLNFGMAEMPSLKNSLNEIAKKTAACAEAAARISAEAARIKNESIDAGIARLSQRPQAFELAAMALRRAKETGEDYAASFAKIRRKFYGANAAKDKKIFEANTPL